MQEQVTQLRTNFQCVILGKQGSGKTLLGKAIFVHYPLYNLRTYCVALTTKPDLETPRVPSEGPNFEIDLNKLGFRSYRIEPGRGWGFSLKLAFKDNPYWILTFAGLSPREREHVLNNIAQDILDAGSVALFVDEAEAFFPRWRAPEGMLDLLRRARWKGIDIIIVAHADTSVHPEVMQEANCIIAFATQHPTRLERLGYYLDDVRVIASLPRYGYILVDDDTGKRIVGNSTDYLSELKYRHKEIFVA